MKIWIPTNCKQQLKFGLDFSKSERKNVSEFFNVFLVLKLLKYIFPPVFQGLKFLIKEKKFSPLIPKLKF